MDFINVNIQHVFSFKTEIQVI